MSTCLYWLPPPEDRVEHELYELKWTLAKELGSYDGSCGENLGFVDHEFIPYLEGIIAGNQGDMGKCAQSLIDAIKKHGRVELVIHS